MKDLLTPPTAEVRMLETKEQLIAKMHKQNLSIRRKAYRHGKLQCFLEAIYLYNVCKGKTYSEEGFTTFKDYYEENGYSKTTAFRFVERAEDLLSKIPNAVYTFGDVQLFDTTKVEKELTAFLDRSPNTTFNTLAKERANLRQLNNYFSSNDCTIPAPEVNEMLWGADANEAPALDGAPISPSKQESLFGFHDRILAAGYEYRNGLYYNRKGEEISDEELGQFVDHEDAKHIFLDYRKALSPAIEEFRERIAETKRFIIAYKKRNTSPNAERFIAEENDNMLAMAKQILFEASSILNENA